MLDLFDNKLSGPLPDAYKALTAVEEVGSPTTASAGSLPPSWGQLKQLKELAPA